MVCIVNLWLHPGARFEGSTGSIVAFPWMIVLTLLGGITFPTPLYSAIIICIFNVGKLVIMKTLSRSEGSHTYFRVWVVSSYLEAAATIEIVPMKSLPHSMETRQIS